MFRIYQEKKVRNFKKILFNPTPLYKVYNYIKVADIDLESVQVNSLFTINNTEQVVLEKDDNGFFIGPGIIIETPEAKQNFTITLDGQQHNISFDVYSSTNTILIGSLVFPEIYNNIAPNDTIRLISIRPEIVYLNSAQVTDITVLDGKYIHNEKTTVIKFQPSAELYDWLNKASNLYTYSLDTPLKDLDMSIYIRCYGGSPRFNLDDPLPQYKLSVENLTTGETTSKYINQFHVENINLKNSFALTITDELDNKPVLANDVATDGTIYVDFSTMGQFGTMAQKRTKVNTAKTLSQISKPLFKM